MTWLPKMEIGDVLRDGHGTCFLLQIPTVFQNERRRLVITANTFL